MLVGMATFFISCQIANMADAAAARREARRRKILENSLNRLQRISGKCEEELHRGTTVRPIFSEDVYDVTPATDSSTSFRSSSSLNNGVVVTEAPAPSSHLGLPAAGDGSQFASNISDIAAFMTSAPEPPSVNQSTAFNKLVLYKYDVVILSLLVQLLYSLAILTFDETHFFLPLLIYVVTKMIWFPTPTSPNFANALLLMNGISVDRVEKIMSIFRCVNTFSQDVCVYLFTTICVQAIYQTIRDLLVT